MSAAFERATRALYERRGALTKILMFGSDKLSYDQIVTGASQVRGSTAEHSLAEFCADVMAVLEAIREPDEAMERAGGEAFSLGDLKLPEAVWIAMIDVLLSEARGK